MDSTSFSATLHLAPLLPEPLLWGASICITALLLLSLYLYRKHLFTRTLTAAIFIGVLLNPSLKKEERQHAKDIATIILDQSPSQNMGERKEKSKAALKNITEKLKQENIDLRIIKTPSKENPLSERTNLFSALQENMADVPKQRRAGIIIISDGQIHDAPKNPNAAEEYGPVHLLLSGSKNEKDRQIKLTQTPSYGLVGEKITIKYIIEDTKNINKTHANVTLSRHDGTKQHFHVPTGQEQSLTLDINHPSQNIFSLEAESVKDEITYANNKTAIIVNGIRDRLKVLLVSGLPHQGERTWRNLLKSDPGVDLVHFTILREPHKIDYTPRNQLSLIAFPFRELFELKLYEFDLIIFDRYHVNNILPDHYFENIVRYVRQGGAFLAANGPTFAKDSSIYNTSIGQILPAKPTGRIYEQSFKPHITTLGHKHPVTKSLIWNNETITPKSAPQWGSWMRWIDTTPIEGDILMKTSQNTQSPLLILNRIGEGRVAQITSDHIWLWSRGYQGGGPHTELLRRIVHWLMKEPELDERTLNAALQNGMITLTKQNHTNAAQQDIILTRPDATQDIIKITEDGTNTLTTTIKAEQLGIYTFEDLVLQQKKFVISGALNPPELNDIKTTGEKLSPLIKASGGTTIWLEKTPSPKIKMLEESKRYGGSNWIALKRNNDYNITTLKTKPLLPLWAMISALLIALIATWWIESRRNTT